MSFDDPDGHYPYPTKGVSYTAPTWIAEFHDGNENWNEHEGGYDANLGQDDCLDDPMDDVNLGQDGHLDDPMEGVLSYEQVSTDDDSQRATSEEGEGLGHDNGQGTFGVELEFLVVECPKLRLREGKLVPEDQHPNDNRWISTKIQEWAIKNTEKLPRYNIELKSVTRENGTRPYEGAWKGRRQRLQYTRFKITRKLRDSGMVVIRWPDIDIEDYPAKFVPINHFSDSEPSEDELEEAFPNSPILRGFESHYEITPGELPMNNATRALNQFVADYLDFHQKNNIKLYRTKIASIRNAMENQCTVGGWDVMDEHIKSYIRPVSTVDLEIKRNQSKQAREDIRNSQVDPLHVPVPGLSPQYKAWTVTVDVSVDGRGMTADRYSNVNSLDPFDEYYWFGAEVVSPVLPTGDERARQAIRHACGSLRNAFRCHKPMEVSTGLHVHLGHTDGWTLFQAKRFATLWLLAEETIYKLHRRDRDQDRKWCAKMGDGSALWMAMFSNNLNERRECSDTLKYYDGDEAVRFHMEMQDNVPDCGINDPQRIFLFNVWQFPSISVLREALGGNKFNRTGIRWRIRGVKSSLEKPNKKDPEYDGPEPGTIEVRIMQGTLDADHINNWIVVLERIVHVVRNLSSRAFKRFLISFVRSDQTPSQLLELLQVPGDVREYWTDPKRRDAEDRWWEYPDMDKVDWTDPFMVPGHKATHGAAWD
ncbi:hypothetical protein SAMD00023353_8300410 [Rosellinia necatrix]|uniref:Amidoligase enzyme n=1 Tax=Rosellinia necatrix TaxID=77044 RepID=A0A1W2TUR6_ROSNE|nr:hypothetical protein SAMD00023353_8300410 [Rosellinia necatrix]